MSKIVKSFIGSLASTAKSVQQVACEELAGDERKAQVFGPANEDFAPPEGTETINDTMGSGRGFLASIAYHNQKITPIALPGERRMYSTPADGSAVKAEIHLKQDGEIYATNGAVTITAKPDGTLTIACDSDISISNPGGSVDLTEAGVLTVETVGDIEINAGGDETHTTAGAAVETVTGKKTVDATAIELNGDADFLTMWTALNTQLQAFMSSYNVHQHIGAQNPPIPTYALDISTAKAATLKTSG